MTKSKKSQSFLLALAVLVVTGIRPEIADADKRKSRTSGREQASAQPARPAGGETSSGTSKKTAAKAPSTENRRAPAAFAVSAEFWKNQQIGLIRHDLCQPKTYHTNCFDLAGVECQREVDTVAQSCAKSLRTPASIRPHHDGRKYGYVFGVCVGQGLEKRWASRKSSENRCYDLKKWL